jgi:hypothetical protein
MTSCQRLLARVMKSDQIIRSIVELRGKFFAKFKCWQGNFSFELVQSFGDSATIFRSARCFKDKFKCINEPGYRPDSKHSYNRCRTIVSVGAWWRCICRSWSGSVFGTCRFGFSTNLSSDIICTWRSRKFSDA